MTKDERFLLELYNQGMDEVDPKVIGQKLGYSDHIIKNIIQGLAQANFIKKRGNEIQITELGIKLAQSLHPS